MQSLPTPPSSPEQLRSVQVVGGAAELPAASGSVPTVKIVVDPSVLKKVRTRIDGLLDTLMTESEAAGGPARSKAKGWSNIPTPVDPGVEGGKKQKWKALVADKILAGLVLADNEPLFEAAKMMLDDLQVPMPDLGALWSDPDIGQVEAKVHVQAATTSPANPGKVLADTPLGKAAMALKIPPQGANKGESIEDFAKRNQVALKFWGAVSAAYTDGLKGEVHVFLPKGITVGSIFWNDELPVLWERKRKGEVTDVKFHLQDGMGGWSGGVTIDDIAIVDAYAADRHGVNRGAESLTDGGTDEKIRATMEKNYRVELKRPIRVGPLRSGLEFALDRARISLMRQAGASDVQVAKAILLKYVKARIAAKREAAAKI